MHLDLTADSSDRWAQRERAAEPSPARDGYAPPQLMVLGTLSELTAGGGVVFDDGAGLAGGSGTA